MSERGLKAHNQETFWAVQPKKSAQCVYLGANPEPQPQQAVKNSNYASSMACGSGWEV